jgi:hypothetical protein
MRIEESVAVAVGATVGVLFLIFFVVQAFVSSAAPGFGIQGGPTPSGPSGTPRVVTITTPNVTTTLTVTTPVTTGP